MKLFQIEEPDGTPIDPDAPGVAIGIDLSDTLAEVAVAVGGNAVVLGDREGFERDLAVPPADASPDAWRALFEGAKLRAERALGQPVTHAVVAVSQMPQPALAAQLMQGCETAGLGLLQIMPRDRIQGAEAAVLTAAILAEDLAPRPPTD